MTGEVRDLLLPAQSLRASVSEALTAALGAWRAHWVPDQATAAFVLRDPDASDLAGDVPGWQPDAQAASAALWWQQQADAPSRVAGMLLGRDVPPEGLGGSGDWALDVAAQALTDLQRRVLQALGCSPVDGPGNAGRLYGVDAASAADWLRPYTGALVADMAALGLRCLLTPEACAVFDARQAAASSPRPDLTALPALLGSHPVRLSLALGVIDVTVEDLMALREGDVVRFPALLAEPLQAGLEPTILDATTPANGSTPGRAVLAVDLGQLGDHLAIQLVGPAKAPAQPSKPITH